MSRSVNNILVIRLLINMAKAIFTQNIRVTALGLENQTSILEQENLEGNLKITPKSFRDPKTILDNIQDTIVLSKMIREENPDVIHVNALQDLLSVFVANHFFVRLKNRPVIVAMSHNPSIWKIPWRAWAAAKFIQLFADGFVCLATTHKDQLLHLGVSESKIAVIPNPYDIDQAKSKSSLNAEKPLIETVQRFVYIANICERKAQDILIRAASLVIKKHPGAKFYLIGKVIPGEEPFAEKVYALAKELGVEGSVHFIGGVPYREVTARLEQSDVFVFPTRSEMMPRSVIEAMLAGKPVVASSVDGILDLIQNRKTGILVQPGNIEELACAICELIENPSLANELGLAGQSYVLEFCSPQRVGGLFRDFYQKIVGAK